MEKEFVPYDLVLTLKELGFDEPCLGLFKFDNLSLEYPYLTNTVLSNSNLDNFCSAPLYQQAFRWFREKYGDYLLYSFGVIPHFTIIQNLIIEDSKITYEEAELECLKKLIEIVKQK